MPIHTHPFQNKLERRGEERRGEESVIIPWSIKHLQ